MAHLGILPTMNMNSCIYFTMTSTCHGVPKRTMTILLTGTTHDSQHRKRLQARKDTFLGFWDPQATLWTTLSKLWNSVTKQKKSTKDWKVKPPISSKWWRIMVGFSDHWIQNTWKWGGRSSLNPKRKTAIGSKCPCNPKTRNLLYLPNPTLFGKNNSTTSFKTLENGGVGHFKTFKIYNNYP